MDRNFCFSSGYNYPCKRTKFTSTEERAINTFHVRSCQWLCNEINPVGKADKEQKFCSFPYSSESESLKLSEIRNINSRTEG